MALDTPDHTGDDERIGSSNEYWITKSLVCVELPGITDAVIGKPSIRFKFTVALTPTLDNVVVNSGICSRCVYK